MAGDFYADVFIHDKHLQHGLEKALAGELQKFFLRLKPQIQDAVCQMVADAITNSPEWKSLQEVGSGDSSSSITLREHFGLANPGPVLQGIVQAVQDGIEVDVVPPAAGHLGGFRVRILPKDYARELAVPGAEYESDSKKGTYVIPWLRWLLIGGAGLLIVHAEINATRKSRAASRTGRAIMVTRTKTPSKGWRVPAEFAGTAENNWLTRALDDHRVAEKIVSHVQSLLA